MLTARRILKARGRWSAERDWFRGYRTDFLATFGDRFKKFVVVKVREAYFRVHVPRCHCRNLPHRIRSYATSLTRLVRSEEQRNEGVYELAVCLRREYKMPSLATAKRNPKVAAPDHTPPAAPPKPKEKKPPRQRRDSKLSTQFGGKKITVLTPKNPKRGKSAQRFAHYKTGMTTEQAVAKGLTWADIEWDQRDHHKYLDARGKRVVGPYIKLS